MRDNLLVLENDGIFYSKFLNCYKTEQVSAWAVRDEIYVAITRLKLAGATPAEREEMRLYFEERYYLKPRLALSERSPTNLLGESAEPSPPPSTPTTKENTMSKAITVTTQVNVNGVNADNYTDSQLFDMIRQQENEIKFLQALTNKPQSLLREIDARQAGIDSLVSFMNERDAKLNPQPIEPIKPTGPDLSNLPGCI
jgi:hypothetical protein